MKQDAAKILDFLQSGLRDRTPDYWWFLGLIFGDGNIYRKKSTARLSVCCNAYLRSVVLRYVGPFHVYPRKNDVFDLYIHSHDLINFYENNYGLCGPKSDKVFVPEGLLQGEFFHFVRGFFDADGTVGVYVPKREKSENPSLKASIASKSHLLLSKIQEVCLSLDINCRINKSTKVMGDKEFTIFNLSFCGEYAKLFLELMYRDKGFMFSDYKYMRYQNYLKSESGWSVCLECGAKAFSSMLCYSCLGKSQRKQCSCGKRALANGVCSAMHSYYDRNNLLPILRYLRKKSISPEKAVESGDFNVIDKMLHMNLVSFYQAKHEGSLSFAEVNDGEVIDNLPGQFNKARINNKKMKPASWFFVEDAFSLMKEMKERFSIESVFDPFAGWGARASGAILNGLRYTGQDMNQYLVHELREVFSFRNDVSFGVVNSFYSEPVDAGLLFTCPPYWGAEDYGYKGNYRETYGEYERFLSRLLRTVILFHRKESSKAACICLEDFYVRGKKYPFYQDMISKFEEVGFHVEERVFREMKLWNGKRTKEYKALVLDFSKAEVRATVSSRGQTKTFSVCSMCEEKAFSDGLCKKHYGYFHTKMRAKSDEITDPLSLFTSRPDLWEKITERKGVVRIVERESKGTKPRRPANGDLGYCKLCDAFVHCSGLCKKHYARFQYRKAAGEVQTVEEFVKSGVLKKTSGVEGKLGEKYIRLEPNGRYMVMIKRVRHGTFKTLSEAVEKRDEVLREST